MLHNWYWHFYTICIVQSQTVKATFAKLTQLKLSYTVTLSSVHLLFIEWRRQILFSSNQWFVHPLVIVRTSYARLFFMVSLSVGVLKAFLWSLFASLICLTSACRWMNTASWNICLYLGLVLLRGPKGRFIMTFVWKFLAHFGKCSGA